jgi:hypothetical protein
VKRCTNKRSANGLFLTALTCKSMHILLEISKLKIITGSNSSTPLFNFLTTTNPLSSKEIYFIINIDTMNEFDA